MTKILSINSGSSSVKMKLFDGENELKSVLLERVDDHQKAIKAGLREIGDLTGIKAAVHRVVHGGMEFAGPTIMDEERLRRLEGLNELAPLHNPYNIIGIRLMMDLLPGMPNIAVFDTAFYKDMPAKATTYAVPSDLETRFEMKRYGFHGISHNYVMLETAKQLKVTVSALNIISCHLGGGWSITAIRNGKPVDTSMGFTPIEGLTMMTRCGDIDAGLVVFLMRHYLEKTEESGVDPQEAISRIYAMLNYESGVKALTHGITDFRDLLAKLSDGNREAKDAFDVVTYRLLKYIGSYWAVLDGRVNAIVFTGAIGAGDPRTRNEVLRKASFLQGVRVLTIETNEELMMAKEAEKLIS